MVNLTQLEGQERDGAETKRDQQLRLTVKSTQKTYAKTIFKHKLTRFVFNKHFKPKGAFD